MEKRILAFPFKTRQLFMEKIVSMFPLYVQIRISWNSFEFECVGFSPYFYPYVFRLPVLYLHMELDLASLSFPSWYCIILSAT